MELKDRFSELDNSIKLAAALAVLLLTGFVASNMGDAPGTMKAAPAVGEPYASGGAESLDRQAATSDSSQGEKIVTTYRMTLEVSNVDSAMEGIESEARAMDGFIESSSRSQDTGNRGSLVVSVPANTSGAFENDLSDHYDVKSKNVDRTDVTDTYNELEAEVESLRTEYRRLNELINQTDDVETLIKLQERLSQVRGQLDYREQRLESLDEDVRYSTFHITLEGPQDFTSRFNLRETLSEAYTALFDSFRLIIIGAAYLVPFALIYAVYRGAIRAKDRGF